MGNRAINPKELAREIHAWDAVCQRRKKAGRSDPVREAAVAIKYLRKAERVLRRCVYEKRTHVKEDVAPFACVDCGGEIDDDELNDAFVENRVHETRCRRCARLRSRA